MTTALPNILTLEEVAEQLRCSLEDVTSELESGRLIGFKVAGNWRLTIDSVLHFIGGEPKPAISSLLNSRQQEQSTHWIERDGFKYKWPSNDENFDSAWEADVNAAGRQLHFLIGFTDRVSAGTLRRRSVVFWGYTPSLRPLVEFVGANDFEKSRRMASVIKGRDGKHIRAIENLPPEYMGMSVATFSDVVIGPYAANSLAVLAGERDWDVMARHGALRAQFKQYI